MIAYFKAGSCAPYSMNLPLTKTLEVGASECVAYSVTKSVDL